MSLRSSGLGSLFLLSLRLRYIRWLAKFKEPVDSHLGIMLIRNRHGLRFAVIQGKPPGLDDLGLALAGMIRHRYFFHGLMSLWPANEAFEEEVGDIQRRGGGRKTGRSSRKRHENISISRKQVIASSTCQSRDRAPGLSRSRSTDQSTCRSTVADRDRQSRSRIHIRNSQVDTSRNEASRNAEGNDRVACTRCIRR